MKKLSTILLALGLCRCTLVAAGINPTPFAVRFLNEGPLSNAAAIWVDPAGSDSNPGTVLFPVKTISHALSFATAGTTVFLYPGTYGETNLLVLTNNCNLVGSGLGVSVITGYWPISYGIPLVPGNNSIISDLSFINTTSNDYGGVIGNGNYVTNTIPGNQLLIQDSSFSTVNGFYTVWLTNAAAPGWAVYTNNNGYATNLITFNDPVWYADAGNEPVWTLGSTTNDVALALDLYAWYSLGSGGYNNLAPTNDVAYLRSAYPLHPQRTFTNATILRCRLVGTSDLIYLTHGGTIDLYDCILESNWDITAVAKNWSVVNLHRCQLLSDPLRGTTNSTTITWGEGRFSGHSDDNGPILYDQCTALVTNASSGGLFYYPPKMLGGYYEFNGTPSVDQTGYRYPTNGWWFINVNGNRTNVTANYSVTLTNL